MNNLNAPPFITRGHLISLAFFSVLFFLVYELGQMLMPFSSALLWAAILALALYPWYTKLLVLVKGRAGLAAAIMTTLTVLVVVGPAIALIGVLATQAVDLYQGASELVFSGKLTSAWNTLADWLLKRMPYLPAISGTEVKAMLLKGFGDFSSSMAFQLGGLLKNTLAVLLNLLIMLVSLFFFFRSGESYYRTAMELLPFTLEQKRAIALKFHDTFTAVINGVFLIALLQGTMTGVGFALFGVPFAVFWGFLAAILALLPIGGAALVWLPGAAYLYLSGSTLHSILLALWGTLLVSLPDNFLKPLIIGKKAKISSFFLFLGILGGLQMYGFLGILFGPLVVTLLTAFIQIYREEFVEQ